MLGYFVLGLSASLIGSLIGAGGGFLIVPLLLLTDTLTPQQIAGTSLSVVFLSKLSAWFRYHRQKRIDYCLVKVLAVSMVPGAYLGFQLNKVLDPKVYMALMGLLLMVTSLGIYKQLHLMLPFFRSRVEKKKTEVVDSCGKHYRYYHRIRWSVLAGFLAGVISPLFGIGGGVIVVPVLVMFFEVPPNIAAATGGVATFFPTITGVFLYSTSSSILVDLVIPLGCGSLLGAQIGAYLGRDSKSAIVRETMEWALAVCGIWLVFKGLT